MKKNIKFQLIPITIRYSSLHGMGMSILGFHWKYATRAIGFDITQIKTPDKDKVQLSIFFYWFIKRIILKSIEKDHYVCSYCNSVLNEDFFCKTCNEYMFLSESIFVKSDNNS